MSPVENLLARLEGVRKHGRHWIAQCPAHADKSPSLSIAECDDGKVLVHCFAGCSALSVVQAVGLTVSDLFPKRLHASTPEECRRARLAAKEAGWGAALNVLDRESTLALAAAKVIATGGSLDEDELNRLRVALHRIGKAREVLRAP